MSSNYEDEARIKEKTKEKRTCIKKEIKETIGRKVSHLRAKLCQRAVFCVYHGDLFYLCLFSVFIYYSLCLNMSIFCVYLLFPVFIYYSILSVYFLCLSFCVYHMLSARKKKM